ncbi:MAG: tetratricopeptide repeat protein [Methylohalobius sp.]|nr:tetratricopeptide repeat protein [Methylohalobius sp.]
MATHIYEQEQVEALKRWWKENSTSLIAGVALGIALIFAWNAWKSYQDTQVEQASELYLKLLNAVAESNHELAEGLASRLTSDFKRTAYADFAYLLLAKVTAEQGQLEGAKHRLESLLTTSKDEDLKHVARLRLARVWLALGQPEKGMVVLTAADDLGRFAAQYEEVKGDLYHALGKPEQALEAYRKAVAASQDSPFLQMKLTELGLK